MTEQEIYLHYINSYPIKYRKPQSRKIESSMDQCLALRAIDMMTDDEVKEVCKIINSAPFHDGKKWKVEHVANGDASYIRMTSRYSEHYFEIDYAGYLWVKSDITECVPTFVNPCYHQAYDYLRFIGISLPFYLLETEQLIEKGWLELTSKTATQS